jgi:exopolyphosphatase / guanosine-5'-triphosphate,3'-diphosphate pyrophosphatase
MSKIELNKIDIMERINFGAIDIGSNAVRLLIMSVSPSDDKEVFNKELMIRVPLRLGQQAFVSGKISDSKRKQLVKTMKAFKHLMNVFEVAEYKACATAAMREAKNAKEIVKEIAKETDIKLEVVDGKQEALMIYESHFLYNLNDQHNYAFVDVGGGSTELSVISNGKLINSYSYNIGTVRQLYDKVDAEEYVRLKEDIVQIRDMYSINDIIASGGNIIKLNTLAKTRKGRKLSVSTLYLLNEDLKALSVEERIENYGLKPDRADVITNAGDIYLDVANALGARNFIVPKIGLIDGLIHLQYTKWKSKKKNRKYLADDFAEDVDQNVEVQASSNANIDSENSMALENEENILVNVETSK